MMGSIENKFILFLLTWGKFLVQIFSNKYIKNSKEV